jgi:hypothetical protein
MWKPSGKHNNDNYKNNNNDNNNYAHASNQVSPEQGPNIFVSLCKDLAVNDYTHM